MAMMLAIGLVIGLVGGFFGGYFYNNFKAEEGTPPPAGEGTGGGTTSPDYHSGPEIIKNPVSAIGPNLIANTKIYHSYTEPYYCNESPGFIPLPWISQPFYRHTDQAVSLVMDGKWMNVVEGATPVKLSSDFPDIHLGYERFYEVYTSEDGLSKIAKKIKVYQKVIPVSKVVLYERATGPGEWGDEILTTAIVKKAIESTRPEFTICQKAGTGGTGGGGE